MKITLRGLTPILLGTIVFAVSQGTAATVPVNNPSFENPPLADGMFVFTIAGWTFNNTMTMSTGTFDPGAAQYPGGAPDGENIIFIKNNNPDTVAQILSTNLAANTIYTLQVDVGARLDFPFGPYNVQLLAGGIVKASNNAATPSAGTFSTVTVQYTSPPDDPEIGLPLEIRLIGLSKSESEVDFDNVRLSAVGLKLAPTLSQYGMVGLLAGLMIFGIRRVRSSRI